MASNSSNPDRVEQADELERVIQQCELSLRANTREAFPAQWAATHHNLAIAYRKRLRGDPAENTECAIAHYELALQLYTRDDFPKQWAVAQNNLAIAYRNRLRGDRADNIERAIEHCDLALQVRTCEAAPTQWAATLANLASAYCIRLRGDRAENIEHAIGCLDQALQVRKREDFPDLWAATQTNLAGAYCVRIRGDRAENIEHAIEHYNLVLQVYTRESSPVHWATVQNDLATAYHNRICGDWAENIECAIEHYELALQIRTREAFPDLWAATQANLASAYCVRIRGDRAENIERAIEHYELALEVRTHEWFPEEWAQTHNNLGNACQLRILGDPAENIERAIEHYGLALQVRTRESLPSDWAMTQTNLAAAYRDRLRGDQAQSIELAIEHFDQALGVRTREAFPNDWAMTQNNLAIAYRKRLRGNPSENVERAIEHYELASQVYTPESFPVDWAMVQNNLAVAYHNRLCGDRAENIGRAIEHSALALKIYGPVATPTRCRRVAGNLGELCFQEQRWDNAVVAYRLALEAAENLYQATLLRSSREAELLETGALHRHAAFALAKAGQLQEAVVTLERGRARGLSEALARDRTDLEAVREQHADLYDSYKEASAALLELESIETGESLLATGELARLPHQELRQRAEALHARLSAVVEGIRGIPGYETFLMQPGFGDVAAAVGAGTPLVYLVTTRAGSLSLVLCRSDEGNDLTVEAIWSDDLTEPILRGILGSFEDPGTWFGAYRRWLLCRDDAAREHWFATLDHALQRIWGLLMDGIVAHLQAMHAGRVILVPAGILSLLPLHAAWSESNGERYCVLDAAVCSYAPSAHALNHARGIAAKGMAGSLLAVAEPRRTDTPPLPYAQAEVDAISRLFEESRLLAREEATRHAVLDALESARVAHFSGHGQNDWEEPLRSGLLMSGGEMLTVQDLLQLRLPGARLATLSACETGIIGTALPDEVISLPAALMRAGFCGIVASLWSVNEMSTALLMMRFYEAWRVEGHEPPEALALAQRWLRNATYRELARYLYGKPQMGGVALGRFLMAPDPSACPYTRPYYWAGFCYTGV